MQCLELKHPGPIRWMHWFNVPLLFGMIWSGLLIYWANDVFRIGLGDWTLFHLFPDWFYDTSTVKYGYKCIKRISVIELTEQRPPDYWAKRSYDWYGGL